MAAAYRDYEMTLDEISARTGMSAKHVEVTLKRALKKIQARPELLERYRNTVELRNWIRDNGGAL